MDKQSPSNQFFCKTMKHRLSACLYFRHFSTALPCHSPCREGGNTAVGGSSLILVYWRRGRPRPLHAEQSRMNHASGTVTTYRVKVPVEVELGGTDYWRGNMIHFWPKSCWDTLSYSLQRSGRSAQPPTAGANDVCVTPDDVMKGEQRTTNIVWIVDACSDSNP